MTILITGGAGYIGSHMALELLDNNENFVILDDLSTGQIKSVPTNIPFYKGDIADTDLVTQILQKHKIEAIIHFAGSIIVPESVKDPLKYYLNNTVKSRSLIQDAVNNNVKYFIFSSTAAVYGMPQNIPVAETEPLNPISPYGTSKLMTELMLQDTAAAHNLSFVALRYFNVAGADPKGRTGQSTPNATHLIKIASQAALGLRPDIQVFGTDYPTKDGTGIRDYIHVSDLSKAHRLALNYLRNNGVSKIINCGYNKGYSVLDIIRTMKEVSGVDIKIKETKRRAGDPAELIAETTNIRNTLKWVPEFDNLDLIIKHALAWEQKLLKGL